MLDDPTYIAQYDHADTLAVIASQGQQLQAQYEFDAPMVENIHNVVLAGMGGSALAAEFVRAWLADRLPVPLEIVRGYDLPAYVTTNSVVVISSFSGNTEETLSCLEQAKQRGAAIVIMASGGKLAEHAEEHSFLKIPHDVSQPRMAVLLGVKALALLITRLGLIDDDLGVELEAAGSWLGEQAKVFGADVDEKDNQAKQIASKLVGHPVVIYGGPTLAMPALKWKIDLNENAKNQAFWYAWPEFNHNEFIGWSHPKNSPLRVVELQSSLDNDRITKRFQISNKLLKGDMPDPIIVESKGDSVLQQVLWVLILGDFVSAYVAFLNKVDPEPVELVEELKKELA